MNKKITKKEQLVMTKWQSKNGACYFDHKNRDIILPDGGLFSIEKKKYKSHKFLRFKKLPDGNSEMIFSKKKLVPSETYEATMWMQELDETINYLKRMKSMLNSIGIKTRCNSS